jgi:hypothetical protein
MKAQSAREKDLLEHLNQFKAAQVERENDLLTHIKMQAKHHKAEIAEMKSTYAQMLEIMQTMNQKLEKLSPPRKRATRNQPHTTLSTHNDPSNSSMDTELSIKSDDFKFSNGDMSVINDISVIQHDPGDPDHTVQSDPPRSQDLPEKPPPC